MEYNTNTERYVPTKEEFTMLLEGASIQSLCDTTTDKENNVMDTNPRPQQHDRQGIGGVRQG
jgi:hypothetical protein